MSYCVIYIGVATIQVRPCIISILFIYCYRLFQIQQSKAVAKLGYKNIRQRFLTNAEPSDGCKESKIRSVVDHMGAAIIFPRFQVLWKTLLMLLPRLFEVEIDRTDMAPSCFQISCLTLGRVCSVLVRGWYVDSLLKLVGRGARMDSGRGFFGSCLSEPEEYAESGGGVMMFSGSEGSSGTGRCFMRFERRREKPVL